jgi:hypothetical protein
MGDERHDDAQHAAQDRGCGFAVLDVHPDEDEALNRQDRGRHDREDCRPVEDAGNDQPGRADQFEDAKGLPGFLRQRSEGLNSLAYLVEQEDLHDARRPEKERGEALQDPQQDVHWLSRMLATS